MRPRLWLLLTALLLGGTPAAAGAAPRIVGGANADITQVPYQVALLDKTRAPDTPDEQICGGTILDATHVATASHCVTGEDAPYAQEPTGDFAILAGASSLSQGDEDPLPSGVQKIDVANVQRNAGYDHDTQADDSTLLTLATPLVYSAQVQQLALTDASPTSGPLLISGWGCTTEYGDADADTACTTGPEYPDHLMSTQVSVVGDSSCESTYASLIPDEMLCAAVQGGGKDTCQGDSGGPAVTVGTLGDFSTYRLAGITSFGDGCAEPNIPGVYAQVGDSGVDSILLDRPAVSTVPEASAVPTVTQTSNAPGGVVTCVPGMWSGSPTFRYAFTRPDGTVVQAPSGAPSYTRVAADTGLTIGCTVIADTPAATTKLSSGQALSSQTTTMNAPPPTTTTSTTTTTTTTTAPTQPVPPPVPDTPAPVVPVVPVTPKDTTPPALSYVGGTTVKVSRSGLFTLKLGAPGESTLTTVKIALSKRVGGRRITVGSLSEPVRVPTATTTLAFALSKANRARLQHAKRLKVTVVITEIDDVGNPATKTLSVTLVRAR